MVATEKTMDLISDLGNDLAFAFLVEKKHHHKIDSKDVLALIGRIKSALHRVASQDVKPAEAFEIEQAVRRSSH